MKKHILILLAALLSAAPLLAQYSPCYEAAFAEGKRLYNAGQYAQANKYFNEAKGCPDPNTAAANKWIEKCNAKISEIAEEYYKQGDRCYDDGDYDKAVEWYRKSADISTANFWIKKCNNAIAAAEKKKDEEESARIAAEAKNREDAAYQNCTTIDSCDSYLKTYPQGRYVTEVKAKKAELEQKQDQQQTQLQPTQNTPPGGSSSSTTGFANGHEWVDLGLPSGTLWATCNVGADTPEGYGDYFAWGETKPKSTYDGTTYKYANGDFHKLTKYCYKSNYGNNGFTDKLTTLQSGDDPATTWGSGWCTPSKEQWDELLKNTTNKWTTQNGVKGRLFTAKNGQSLFLPAAGFRVDNKSSLGYEGRYGYYWSSSLYTDDPIGAWDFYFDSGWYYTGMYYDLRIYGRSVRAVRSAPEYVDLDLPSGTLWATCNLGASKPESYGNYYAWGETSTKSTYNWTTYKYANGDSDKVIYDKLTKYCNKSNYGNNEFTDKLTTLQSGDDPATTWGSGWCTPSKEQWDELLKNTTNKWTTQNGVKGRLFTAKNGQSLFLPAAGYRWNSDLGRVGSYGYYWSSSLGTDYPSSASCLIFYSDECRMFDSSRYYGYSVRPVRQK